MASPEHRDAIDGLDLHRPFVDEVTLDCPHCEGVMRRIPEVMDAWFDSGAMPVAQWNVTSMEDLERISGGKASSPPSTYLRPLTRPGAGSTACWRYPPSSRGSPATRTSSAWGTSWTKRAGR